MRGVVVEQMQGSWKAVEDLPMPEPAKDQILVKSIYTAINPVDAFMVNFGLLVESWPLVPGCDAGGKVVKVGKDAISPLGKVFREGDGVCGCTRLGMPGYSPFQEYFLMDAKCTTPVPDNMSLKEACTLGVATYTAALAVFNGLNVPLPDPQNLPAEKDEWAMVLGGSSSVGKAAVQILKACGYKVLASCSAGSFDLLKTVGATACVDYKQSADAFASKVQSVTGGKLSRIFDAVGQSGDSFPSLLGNVSIGSKYFSTTNDNSPIAEAPNTTTYGVALGPIGRPFATELNSDIEKFIPVLYEMMSTGKLTPAETYVVGGKEDNPFEDIIEAYNLQQSGKAGSKKVVVKVADA